ncbi:holin [Thermoanaerobacterium sp. PSU-2]|uniref:phage holin family protein n=1 Tax=Thermoanaerobacterium sp. PSU-2 TaxID=1930849 RepID=UPI000A15ABE3|nr:phage holin family protein [Thermoanaerobacterium sp. PSU-2]ORX22383.1 holin [Thermoanaerobacterium sp. PSU-2]
MKYENIFKTITAFGGALASYLFGGWSALLGILLAFVIFDYITGVIAAGIEGKLSSNAGLKGIAKKVGIFVIVAVANLVDRALGNAHIFRDATIFFYLANELLSIIENVGRSGIPIPEVIKKAVAVLQGKGGIEQ